MQTVSYCSYTCARYLPGNMAGPFRHMRGVRRHTRKRLGADDEKT